MAHQMVQTPVTFSELSLKVTFIVTTDKTRRAVPLQQ